MTETLVLLDTMVSQLVARQTPPTPESIRDAVTTMRILPTFSEVSDEDAEMLARELEERVGISMGLGAIVEDQEFRPWLHDARAKGLIEIGRAHVRTPVTNAHHVRRLLLEKKKTNNIT